MSNDGLLNYISLFREKAEQGKLVIFVGAGVSQNVDGMPSWNALIQNMAKAINYSRCNSCRHKAEKCESTCLLKEDFSGATKRAILADLDTVLSLELTKPWEDAGEEVDEELSAFVEGKIAERAAAKKAKDFAKADAIRDELKAKGILIKDTREGVVWEKIGE